MKREYVPWRAPFRHGRLRAAIAFAAVLATAPAVGYACDLCAIYSATETGQAQSGFRLGTAEQFTRYTTLQDGSEEVPNPYNERLLSGLELGRINVAARGVGVARAALQDAVAYAQVRKTFGKPICEHQAIQLKLGEMATRLEAARLLVESAARAYDRGERCDMEAGMAKYFATEAAMENALESMRIHGAYGYSKEYNVERYFRDAPLLLIGEGTNEMQRIIIAKQLIARNPA